MTTQRCPKCWDDGLVWTRLTSGAQVQVPCPVCALPHATMPVSSPLLSASLLAPPPPPPLVKAFDDLKVGDRFLVQYEVVSGIDNGGDIRVHSTESPGGEHLILRTFLSKRRYEAVVYSASQPKSPASDEMTDRFRPRTYPDETPVDGTKYVLYRLKNWKKGAWSVQNIATLSNGEIWRYMPPEADDP